MNYEMLKSIRALQERIADAVYENYLLDGLVISEGDGWQTTSEMSAPMTRNVYAEDGDGSSHKLLFRVTFNQDGSLDNAEMTEAKGGYTHIVGCMDPAYDYRELYMLLSKPAASKCPDVVLGDGGGLVPLEHGRLISGSTLEKVSNAVDLNLLRKVHGVEIESLANVIKYLRENPLPPTIAVRFELDITDEKVFRTSAFLHAQNHGLKGEAADKYLRADLTSLADCALLVFSPTRSINGVDITQREAFAMS